MDKLNTTINLETNKTFCILPWIHLNVWPNGNVYQCCITSHHNTCGSMKETSLDAVWNNEYMRDLRVALRDGDRHPSCNNCYSLEDNNLRSTRQSSNENFKHHIESSLAKTHANGHSEEFKLIYWDFRFSNLCNFKCRMCGEGLSSAWTDDQIKLKKLQGQDYNVAKIIHINDNSKTNINDYLNRYIDTVEEIYFAGGEPLLMEEHYFILDELIKRGRTDVRIRYNTNLSKLTYKKWNVIDYWKKFSNVDIFASIDAIGTTGEYIRSGTNWAALDKNIRAVTEFNPDILGASVTVQLFNVLELPETIDYFIKSGIKYHRILISNVLHYPLHYSIQLLPDDLKQLAEQRLNKYLATLSQDVRQHFEGQITGIIDFMKTEMPDAAHHRHALKNITNLLDSIRSESVTQLSATRLVDWIKSL